MGEIILRDISRLVGVMYDYGYKWPWDLVMGPQTLFWDMLRLFVPGLLFFVFLALWKYRLIGVFADEALKLQREGQNYIKYGFFDHPPFVVCLLRAGAFLGAWVLIAAAFSVVAFFLLAFNIAPHDFRNIQFMPYVIGVVLGVGFFLVFNKTVLTPQSTRLNRWIQEKTLKIVERKSDVRNLSHPKVKDFDPRAFFTRKDSVFLGLNGEYEPVFIPRDSWMKSNVQILGVPGSGKTLMATCALVQCVKNFGDCVVFFDPKKDSFAPHILRQELGERFVYLNLKKTATIPPQFNLFAGLERFELEELLEAGFALGRTGEASDFYRNDDRAMARKMDEVLNGQCINIKSLISACESQPDSEKLKARNFIAQLEELASLPVLQTDCGPDLAKLIEDGGLLYIVGDTAAAPVVMLQKMLLVRVLQLVKRRSSKKTHVNIFLDEFKYLLSRSALNALGTVRDQNCNILLAHQSLGDLEMCGADIPTSASKTIVLDNTPLKWIYRTKDYATAEWAAQLTGEKVVKKERREIGREGFNSEVASSHVQVVDEVENLVTTNDFQNLEDRLAVCVGYKLADYAMSSSIPLDKSKFGVDGKPMDSDMYLNPAKPFTEEIQPTGSWE